MPSLPPEDYTPSQRIRAWAEVKVPGVDVDDECEAWVDWCHANNKKYYDLEAALRTWLRRAKPNHTPAPALQVRQPNELPFTAYIGPKPLPLCLECGRLKIDCSCGVQLRGSG